jgi:ferritin-like metal-binding protein YciE
MKTNSLHDLYLEQLKDLCDAEHQLIKALQKMAKAASSPELRAAFEEHLEETKEHAQRIETIFEGMGEKEADQLLGNIAEKINVEIPRATNQSAKQMANTSGQRSKPAA